MDLTKMLTPIFSIVFIIIVYFIIITALKIMNSDVKNGDKKKILKKSLGLEVMSTSEGSNVKKGSIVPIGGVVTIGRHEDNSVILKDPYVSGYHAKIFVKNKDCYVEDMGSTNGTFLNEEKVKTKTVLEIGDEISIGNTLLKVIG
ncbi:FHA domain-containing protein [Clostridium oryzae]|uniref:FHA domain-containing protein FhaB n=1 Tax=Clostridium oryzae TaxID=1450648 RepID=A0A1V4IYG5_9CLOT|nr:FHA domain-containing protein [Clostridium oryzae]OPJ65112.1 FHA domain-containing protein FhaB [Clostridium oryzae]